MKSNRSALRVFAAFSAVGILAIVFWCLWPAVRSPADPACITDPTLRLNVGWQIFAVPRKYLPNVYIVTTESHDLLSRPICQRPEDPPINTRMFSIHPGEQPGFVEDDLTKPLGAFQIEIHKRRPSYRTAREAYEDALAYLEQQGVRLEDLPVRGGFRAYDTLPKGRHIYVALSVAGRSPGDVPLVIECSAPGVAAISKEASGRMCRTAGYQEVVDDIVVHYDFRDGDVPVSSWLALDRQIHAFVMSMQNSRGLQ